MKLLWLFEELDNLLQLFLGFLDTRDVFERDALLLIAKQLRARLAEGQRFIAARLHLSQHENPEAENQSERQKVIEGRPQVAAAA